MIDPVRLYRNHLKATVPAFGENGHSTRSIAMFVVRQFTGLNASQIADVFNITRSAALMTLRRQEYYHLTGNTNFERQYNNLLDTFIDCCRIAWSMNRIR